MYRFNFLKETLLLGKQASRKKAFDCMQLTKGFQHGFLDMKEEQV